ncbi:MAG: hypothetical protein GY731_12365, partial [Gammaproteobacteria bacterium]|nr:hypothetical protein [Gammaproteobacteria bacterium]
MNDELTSESQRVCRELQALRESATASEDVADTAAQWISSISPNQDYLPEDEMRREIEIFAQDEWLRRQPDVQRCGEDDTDPSSQEVYRAIRGL